MDFHIRAANADDAAAISAVIIAALRETNARDYPENVIRKIEQSFGPAEVEEMLNRRKVFVALREAQVIGTASLDGRTVRTVFVAPSAQGQGAGKLLMAEIERAAREAGVETLAVSSSITAENFYLKLGFKPVRDSYYGEERTVIMERSLATA